MKVAVNTRFLLPGKLEGIGWFTHEVARRLVAAHPEHEFIFLFDRPYDQAFVFGENVRPVVVFPPARHPVLWYAWFELSLPRRFRRLRPDVFFSPDGYLSLRAEAPSVMVTHDLAHLHFPRQIPRLVRRYYDFFVPKFLNRADRVVAVSEFTRRDIVAQFGLSEQKIAVAGNGIRAGFAPLNSVEQTLVRERYSDGQSYFFYVGAIHPRKNVDGLIAAFDRFKGRTEAPVKLLIGGRDAWQTTAVRQAYDNARYREDIRFLGFVPDEELPRLMASALAFVYPSVFEGFGVPVLEAMHCDTAVITSNVSSLPEVAGPAAYLIDPRITDQLAVAMQEMYGRPDLRQAYIEQGRRQRRQFSWDQTAATVWEAIVAAAR